jgi:hypothetical protein
MEKLARDLFSDNGTRQRTTSFTSVCRKLKRMKSVAIFITAVCLARISTAFGDNYSLLAADGYRWVAVNGPYACTSEEEVQQIVSHHTDETELRVVQNIQCYYLIPGDIAQIIKEDPARGLSQVRLGSITRPLWTYTRFLSKHPVHDTYGAIETPELYGLVPTANTVIISAQFSNSPTTRTRQNPDP